MFSVLNALWLRPLPHPSPEQLAMLWTEMPNQQLREGRSAFRDVEQWQRQSKTFEEMSVSDGVSVWLTAPGELERISVVRASPNFFSLLGVQPVRGRVLFERGGRRGAGALQSSVISSGRHAWEDWMPSLGKRSRLTIFRPRSSVFCPPVSNFLVGLQRCGSRTRCFPTGRAGAPKRRVPGWSSAACGPASRLSRVKTS